MHMEKLCSSDECKVYIQLFAISCITKREDKAMEEKDRGEKKKPNTVAAPALTPAASGECSADHNKDDATCETNAQDFKDYSGFGQCITKGKVETYISLMEQKLKQLAKTMDTTKSQAEKEELFRKVTYEVNRVSSHGFLLKFGGECHEKWNTSNSQHAVVLSTLAKKHGCMHIMAEYQQLVADKLPLPGSGLRMQLLYDIMCANSTPTINQVALCEERGTMVCSGCYLVKYCSKRCQKKHWPAHKDDCKSSYAETARLKDSDYNMTTEDARTEKVPQIVFHSKAIQFPMSATNLPIPCSACLAKSGDLSDMVLTILSVPDGYEGEITLHLNHPSPNIAFCNLLSILAMGKLGELSCDMLIQLWYSVAMTYEQMQHIHAMLGNLVEDSRGEVMEGNYSAALPKLSQTMLTVNIEQKHWFMMLKDLQSPRHIVKCMKDRHKHLFGPHGKTYAVEMLTTLSSHQRVSWDIFMQLGMLLPLGAFNAHHNVQNPFLFDVNNRWRPEHHLDPLQCWSRDEIIAAGDEFQVPRNDIYGALFFLVRKKLSACIQKLSKHRFHIIATCCEPSALIHRLQQSKTAMNYISGVDTAQLQYTHLDDQELKGLSVRALKEIIQGAGVSLEGCLEKSDLVARAALILGRAAPPNVGTDTTAAETNTSPPTQQQFDEASEQLRFIEARASLDPPDILAICYLAKLGKIAWMKRGVEMSNPECFAIYGWHQLCLFGGEDALDALSHLQQAKDMKNVNGLLFWGLAMDSAYGDATDTHSEAWICYHKSACLGNYHAMYNVAHILAARGDHKRAIEWWKKAAQHGPSLFELYLCYHKGQGCTHDDLQAGNYLKQAADKGYGPACLTLSEWYSSGWENVLRKNPEKHAYWCKQATVSSEEHPLYICDYPLRSLLGTNATPTWWKSLRAVVELMDEPSNVGTMSEGSVSVEVDNTFDTSKFAFAGAEKFIMQMNLTSSTMVGIPHYSFLQRAESLALTSDEQLQLQGIVQEITDVLISSKVFASVAVCGSFSKGTAVRGCADLDIVATTVKCFECDMYLSLQRHAATLLINNLKVDVKYRPLAVSFTYKHVEIDVVIASPNIEPISQCYLPPRARYFRRPSLSVRECGFLRAQPPLFGAVVRLLKDWRACAENWPYRCKPRSFLLELTALAAVQKVDASQLTEETVRDGFVTSLELLLIMINSSLKLYRVDNYPEYSIEFGSHDEPMVMDLVDPTNNLAGLIQIQDWYPLSKLAEQTLIAIRDCNLMQRGIHITPTAEQDVSAISPQYRFSCSVLRAEQLMRAGNLEEALDALATALLIDSSNVRVQCMWFECIKQLSVEAYDAKQPSLTEAELLSTLKDDIVNAERVSIFSKELKKQQVKVPSYVTRDMHACEEMNIPFSTYMCLHDEDSDESSEDEDIPRMKKLFPDPSEDKFYSPLIKSVVTKSDFKDGKYSAWLMLKQLTDKMPSKEQRDMYTKASLQSVLAYEAFCVGKDVTGLDRMTASILATAQTPVYPELHAFALTVAKREMREASSEVQVLPHCGLSLQVAANIVLVHVFVFRRAWAKASEALKHLLKRDNLYNRADVCYFIGNSLSWTFDQDAAIVWHERGIAADPTFRINLWALGNAMIHASSTQDAGPEKMLHILKTAEKHLWQYIKQGVPEDKKRSDAMYELVYVAMLLSNFQEAHHTLEMAIEADIRRTEVYNEPSSNDAKQFLLVAAIQVEHVANVKGDNPDIQKFFHTVRTKLCKNPSLITPDRAMHLKEVSLVSLHATKEYFSRKMTASFWNGDILESESAADILKNLMICENSIDSEGNVIKQQEEKQKILLQTVVDCEGSGDFLSLGEALKSRCIGTNTLITIKGGTYKEKTGLCIQHEHLTIQAASSKEKVIIQSYANHGIRVEANNVTLSGLSVEVLSPKDYDGVKEIGGHAIHIRAGTAIILENCSATNTTGAAIAVGDGECPSEIEVTMVMCSAKSSIGNAIICSGSHTQVQLQHCTASHSISGLEVRMGAIVHVRSSKFFGNKNLGILVWQHANAKTVVGPDNVIKDNQGSGAILSARGIIFHGNKVTGNKLYGVSVEHDPAPGFKAVEVKIENCKLSQNGWGGVQFDTGTGGVISGCHIKKNNQCGIMVGTDVEKLTIIGNQIQGNYSLEENGIMMFGNANVADDNHFSNNQTTQEKLNELLISIKLQKKRQAANTCKLRQDNLISKKNFGKLQCSKCKAEVGPDKKMVPCVKCYEVVYCSTQCLKSDAKEHHNSCNPVPYYVAVDGEEITLDVDHLHHMRAERENAGMMCANCGVISINEDFMKCAACKCDEGPASAQSGLPEVNTQ